MKRVTIEHRLFTGRKTVPWNEVENYLKRYIGQVFIIKETQDRILIPTDFPDEYAGSDYTKRLRGAVAKAKANLIPNLDALIQSAANKRFVENKSEKHNRDACFGWYRYTVAFGIIVKGDDETIRRENIYRGTLVVRCNKNGKELYDIVNIKKEASKPL